jgi:hypothetical protein
MVGQIEYYVNNPGAKAATEPRVCKGLPAQTIVRLATEVLTGA